MEININYGILISIFGLLGLVFSLADSQGEIGSKVPLALFFLFIMGIGIALNVFPPEYTDDEFGERDIA